MLLAAGFGGVPFVATFLVLGAIAPLIAVGALLQDSLVRAATIMFLQFLAPSMFVIFGMLLLFIGLDFGIVPMAKFIGAEPPKRTRSA